jgi:dipeptidyl aminopeptidase/acylaminoacyl peptidase
MLRLVVILLALWIPTSATGEPPERLPVEVFFADPLFESPAFSPGGSGPAGIMHSDGVEFLLAPDRDSLELEPILQFRDPEYRITWVQWVNDERLLFGISYPFKGPLGIRPRGTHLHAVNADGSNRRRLGRKWKNEDRIPYQDRIVSMLRDDPQHVLIQVRINGKLGVHRMDVDRGHLKRVVKPQPGITHWMADHDDVVKVGVEPSDQGLRVIARASAKEAWKEIFSWDEAKPEVHFEPIGFDFDGRTLFVSSTHESDKARIYRYDLKTTSFGDVVFSHDEVDVDGGLLVSRKRRKVLAIGYTLDDPAWHFLDEAAKQEWAAIGRVLPGSQNRIVSQTRDENQLVIRSSGDTTAPVYYIYDRKKGSVELLFREYPDLPSEILSPMQAISYGARDGRLIHGYLTLPVGHQPNQLPMVVMPHGGPTARDRRGFDPAVQFLANRGYAVLQINFRGSTGYGIDHMMAGMQEYGLAMQDDISDGVHWVLERGAVDPARICIFGASYGGYAALMGVIKTPELFRCAATYAGVTDLATIIRDDRWYHEVDLPLFPDDTDKKLREAVSPLRNVDKINAPVLIAHGEQDWRVHVKHAKKLAKALKKAGKPYELYLYDDEIHGFAEGQNSVAFYRAPGDFLDRHIGDGAATVGAVGKEATLRQEAPPPAKKLLRSPSDAGISEEEP